ncbi:MAG: hypothetical protein ACWIPI_10750 [Polaribacter sp.]
MKLALKILFIIFIIWITIGIFLLNEGCKKAPILMGSGVFFVAFICMPLFIYYRYKDGKYKKYIINDQKLRDAFKDIGKD